MYPGSCFVWSNGGVSKRTNRSASWTSRSLAARMAMRPRLFTVSTLASSLGSAGLERTDQDCAIESIWHSRSFADPRAEPSS